MSAEHRAFRMPVVHHLFVNLYTRLQLGTGPAAWYRVGIIGGVCRRAAVRFRQFDTSSSNKHWLFTGPTALFLDILGRAHQGRQSSYGMACNGLVKEVGRCGRL